MEIGLLKTTIHRLMFRIQRKVV